MNLRYLTINKCTKCNIYSISVDDDNGGVRITPNKCCGAWHVVTSWVMGAEQLRSIARTLMEEAEQLERVNGN